MFIFYCNSSTSDMYDRVASIKGVLLWHGRIIKLEGSTLPNAATKSLPSEAAPALPVASVASRSHHGESGEMNLLAFGWHSTWGFSSKGVRNCI